MSWSKEDEQELFKLHLQFGNRWALIAMRMNREQCKIKNKFYSTLRKGYRKMNSYIVNIKRKRNPSQISANKLLKPQFITKLAAIAGENFEEKYEVKPPAIALSKDLQQGLCRLACSDLNYDKNGCENYNFQQNLLDGIHMFIKNCKKRKGNKKFRLEDSSSSPQRQSESDQNSLKQQQSQQSPIKVKQKPKRREVEVQQKIIKNEEGEQAKKQNLLKKDNFFRYEIPEQKLYEVNQEYQAKIQMLFDEFAGGSLGDRLESNKTPFSIISTHKSFFNLMNASPYTSDYFNFMQAFTKNTTKMQTNSMIYSANLPAETMTKSDSIMERFQKLSFLEKIPIMEQSMQNPLFFQSSEMTIKRQKEGQQSKFRKHSQNSDEINLKGVCLNEKNDSISGNSMFHIVQVNRSSEATYSDLNEQMKQKMQNSESCLKDDV